MSVDVATIVFHYRVIGFMIHVYSTYAAVFVAYSGQSVVL